MSATRRSFHAIDIENLVGSGRPTEAAAAALRAAYVAVVNVTPLDQMVVACNRGSLVDVGFGWGPRHAQYRVGVGRNGADWELLGVLECEGVADRFRQVVIASGDGIFAPMAARLAEAGCEVTVVSRRVSLSARLKLAAKRVVYLPDARLSTTSMPLPVGEAAVTGHCFGKRRHRFGQPSISTSEARVDVLRLNDSHGMCC